MDPQANRRARWAAPLLLRAASLGFAAALHAPLLLSPAEVVAPEQARLVAEAQRELARPDQGVFDYGSFFLQAEALELGESPEPLIARWTEARELVRRRDTIEGERFAAENLERVVTGLFHDLHLGSYQREQAAMSGFLRRSEPGGNCEAETKLIVAAVTALLPRLTPPLQLGVQVYDDHLQAVVVDLGERRVWNLLTGEQKAPLDSPVYRPAILLHAYLRGLGHAPPVDEASLLLAGEEGQARAGAPPGEGFRTSSKLRFPAAARRRSAGPIPERARLPFPFVREATSAGDRPARSDLAVDREAFLREEWGIHLFSMDAAASPFGVALGKAVFDDPAEALRFNRARTKEERRQQLLALAEGSLRRKLESEALRGAVLALRSPPALARMSPEQMASLTRELHRIDAQIDLAEYAASSLLGDLSAYAVPRALETSLPALGEVRAAVRSLGEEAGRDPGRFAQLLAELGREPRRLLIDFLRPSFRTEELQTLSLYLADPAKTSLELSSPAPASWLLLEAELVELPTVGRAAPDTAHPPPRATPEPPVSPPRARHEATRLGRQAFEAIVLGGLIPDDSAEGRAVLERWDASMSEHLEADLPSTKREACVLRQAVESRVILPAAAEGGLPPHLTRLRKALGERCKREDL